jgi:hypothetical protein
MSVQTAFQSSVYWAMRVQRVKHRSRHVPVEIVRRETQRIGVRQQLGESAGNRGAISLADVDVMLGVRPVMGS